jgi:hypothetical protein
VGTDLKQRVIGLNKFLSVIYKTDMRLSVLLCHLRLDFSQIELLRADRIEKVFDSYVGIIKSRISRWEGGERLFAILCHRFGLDGAAAGNVR